MEELIADINDLPLFDAADYLNSIEEVIAFLEAASDETDSDRTTIPADEVKIVIDVAVRALRRIDAAAPNDHAAIADHLEKIVAYAYQIAGVHDVPEHILDVLSDPCAASAEQVEAMLPYQPADRALKEAT